jgi:hypothetical protein
MACTRAGRGFLCGAVARDGLLLLANCSREDRLSCRTFLLQLVTGGDCITNDPFSVGFEIGNLTWFVSTSSSSQTDRDQVGGIVASDTCGEGRDYTITGLQRPVRLRTIIAAEPGGLRSRSVRLGCSLPSHARIGIVASQPVLHCCVPDLSGLEQDQRWS